MSTRGERRAVSVMGAVAAATLPALVSPRPALAEPSCGDLLVVYDRSGSMGLCSIDGTTKEQMAKKAMKSVFSRFSGTPMGLLVFPDTLASCPFSFGEAACKPGKVVVEMTAAGASAVGAWLDKMPESCGGTPTGGTLQRARDYDRWTPGMKHYVLVLTDGQPTCDDGDDGGTPMGFGGVCMGGGPGVPCNGLGVCQCKNPTKAFDAIRSLYDRGIHTFVVGFEGKGEGIGCADGMPLNPNTLNKMAELGGEANAAGPTKYFSAVDEKSLIAALDKIAGAVAGATAGGCRSGGSDAGAGGSADAGSGGRGGGPAGGGQDAGTGGPEQPPGGGRHSAPGCVCSSVGAASVPGPAVGAAILAAALASLRSRARSSPRPRNRRSA